MQIDLTNDEMVLLGDLLRISYDELREEIYKTEDTDYKRQLKTKEQALQSLLHKIDSARS
ncbi:MAG: hypothetical protein E6J43_10965 [Chloroflexi bacterium]|nr:MAG: hypothetical protein E6J43_10965 [Chloroflexota bacterium]